MSVGWGGRGAGIRICSPASRHPHSRVPDPGPGPPVPHSSVRGPLWKLGEERLLPGRLESAFQSQVSVREDGARACPRGLGSCSPSGAGDNQTKAGARAAAKSPLPGRDPGASMRQASKGDGPCGASDHRIPPRLSMQGAGEKLNGGAGLCPHSGAFVSPCPLWIWNCQLWGRVGVGECPLLLQEELQKGPHQAGAQAVYLSTPAALLPAVSDAPGCHQRDMPSCTLSCNRVLGQPQDHRATWSRGSPK